jgi:ElaB/YqjD/DUF883 family membrane-anchored ribosome-binding protein
MRGRYRAGRRRNGINSEAHPMTSSATAQDHSATSDAGGQDGLAELRREFASLKDHVARFAAQAGGEVAKSIGDAAGSATGAGSDLVSNAAEQAKTFAAELEGMARRNPLGTIAGAVLVGVVIGMISRGRG